MHGSERRELAYHACMGEGGWIPSGFDGRDWQWSRESNGRTLLFDSPSTPIDQGHANCCVAAAITSAMEIIDAREGTVTLLSPLFNYFLSRRSKRSLGNVELRTGLRAAARHGVCASELHEAAAPRGPLSREDALKRPNARAKSDARKRRIHEVNPNTNMRGYYRLDGGARLRKWKSALRRGCPIVFGFYPTQAYQALDNAGRAANVSDVHDDRGGRHGHAALVVGYRNGTFIIRDSRGTGFANRGYWTLAESIVHTAWVAESWAISSLDDMD